jgi:glutamate synthase domain-containing protein 1
MLTDTEVVAYLFDLLGREHGLPSEMVVKALAPPFWDEIDVMPEKEEEFMRTMRLTYGPALMNGPFAIVVATKDGIVAFTDRIKLRPLIVGENGPRLYISSEEAAIRTMDPDIETIYMPRAGEPVIGRVIE